MTEVQEVYVDEELASCKRVVGRMRELMNGRRGSSLLKVRPDSVLWYAMQGGGEKGAGMGYRGEGCVWSWGMLQGRLGLVVNLGLREGIELPKGWWAGVEAELEAWGAPGGCADVEGVVERWIRELRAAGSGATGVSVMGSMLVGLDVLTQERCMSVREEEGEEAAD